MKSLLRLSVILLSVTVMVTGCDFFRVLAGRPTSKEIEAKRVEILHRAVQQSQDSVKVDRSPVKPGVTEEAAEPVRPAGTTSGEKKRFYVIMGAFSSRENAERYAERVRTFGYEPEFFGFTEGRTAVGIGGTDDAEQAKAFMKELKGQDFCPDGVWILDRKRK